MPKIVIDFKLDQVPGWGYKVEDFVEVFKSSRTGVQHYINSVEVLEEDDGTEPRCVHGELEGECIKHSDCPVS